MQVAEVMELTEQKMNTLPSGSDADAMMCECVCVCGDVCVDVCGCLFLHMCL